MSPADDGRGRTAGRVEVGALPVDAVLDALVAALTDHGVAVLEAPPGAGKTTRVPLVLLERGLADLAADEVGTDGGDGAGDRRSGGRSGGRIVVLEPRRVAARAAAGRLAEQLGEPVGRTVGLTTRDERRTSRATRIEVVTDGVVLRRLQRDPGLEGVAVLLFDEFHERGLEADLALAFALESRAALRPDLALLVASATLDGARVAAALGGAPVVRAEGRSFPVTVQHREPADPRQLDRAVADAVADALDDADGDLLVFLPGVREIRRTARLLDGLALAGAPRILPLHGSLPPAEQDAAIRPAPDGRRKVILATDLAESSLTIDGVTTVVDAGRSREPRFDAATGMAGLVTVPASRASADQRAGRAGRTAPGRAVRLWPEREHAGRDAHPRAAMVTDDLTRATLEIAAWGASVDELVLLDAPPAPALSRARQTLAELGALGADGTITPHGRALVAVPAHPRVAHLLLVGRDGGVGTLATELAAVLADRDPLMTRWEAPCADLAARVRVLRGGAPPAGVRVRRGALDRARREQRRLARLLDVPADHGGDVEGLGGLVLAGWPDRLAAARPDRRGRFVLASGRGAVLSEGDVLAGEALLAVAHLDRGDDEARIHLAAAVDEGTVRAVAGDAITVHDEIQWRDGDVVAERREQLGAVVLHRRDAAEDPDRLHAALLDGIAQEGVGLLQWTDADRELQARVALVRAVRGSAWPDLGDDRLVADAPELIGGFLLHARRRRDLTAVRAGDVLAAQLAPGQRRELDRLAPTHLSVPSGSSIRLDYTSGDRPVLAVRVQELFGARRTPSVVDGQVSVLVHLLSPAQRPVQVTDDLAGFWERTYPEVRAELRGRYPKHAWPEDPLTATAVRGTGRRRGR